MSRVMRNPHFAYGKTKAQISCAVTAKLISAFVFATQIVQFLYISSLCDCTARFMLDLVRTQIVGFLMQGLVYEQQ